MKCLAKSTGDNGFYPEGSSPNFASNIKDTLKAFGNFKNKQKSVRSNVFWYVKVGMFWKCIQYTIHWDKT